MAEALARSAPKFRLGRKQVFLPNHVITLLRKEHYSPYLATFQVPLRFTKFDLRDYLYNLYNVEATRVRSLVQQQSLTRNKRRMFYRPRPKKYMTIEMAKPFAWPDVPEDREAWNHQLWESREKELDARQDRSLAEARGKLALPSQQPVGKGRRRIAEMAQALLRGEAKWENGIMLDEKWSVKTSEPVREAAEGKPVS